MKTKILITVEGGVVSSITTNCEEIEVHLLDYDEFDAGPSQIVELPIDRVLETAEEFEQNLKQLEKNAARSV